MSKRTKIIIAILAGLLSAFVGFPLVGLPITVFNVVMFIIMFSTIGYMEINNKFY